MIKTIREITVYNGMLYVRQGLASDVVDLQANYINAVGSKSRDRKYKTGDIFKTTDTGVEYEFEEGSNQWYLQV